jgi:hypothetical protein
MKREYSVASAGNNVSSSQLERLFPGDSEMAVRMRAYDWAATDFGPPENWPENLRVAVSICLPCRYPIVLWWVRSYVFSITMHTFPG